MPTNRKNINPLDLRSSVAVGINLPFSKPNAITSTYTTQEAIKNNIVNFTLTNFNERLYRPNYGGNIQFRLFEVQTEDELEILGQDLKENLETVFEGIKVTDISFKPNPDENRVNFFITYVLATGTTDSVSFTL